MKKLLLATSVLALSATGLAGSAQAEVKLGVILGFTGPIESITPTMAAAAEMAMTEVNDSGKLLGGETVTSVRADSTCIDSAAATAAAEGQVLADMMKDQGITEIAVTYTNNDYGKGLADSFQAAFEAAGGKVSISVPHEDGKGDYSAEVATLAATGSKELAVFGYVDQGGRGIIQSALDTGAFDKFVLCDGMIGDSLLDAFGASLNGTIGTLPGNDGEGATKFLELAKAQGVDGSGAFAPESYDAAALLMLAMEAAGSTDRAAIQAKVLDVANGPGEPILPGELGKALEIIAKGGDVDYVGATGVELIGPGEAAGSYKELLVDGGKFTTVQIR